MNPTIIKKIISYINIKYKTQYNFEYVNNIFLNNLVNEIKDFNTKAYGYNKKYNFIKLIISNLSKEIVENINVKIFVLSDLKFIIKYSELFTNKKLFEIINHWIITDKINLINQLDLLCLDVYTTSINWNKNKILTEYLLDMQLLNINNIEYVRIDELPKKYQNIGKLLVKLNFTELLNTNIIQTYDFNININTSDSNYINNIIVNFSFKKKDILAKEIIRFFSNKNMDINNIKIKEYDLIKLFNLLDKKNIMDNNLLLGLYSNGYILALDHLVKNFKLVKIISIIQIGMNRIFQRDDDKIFEYILLNNKIDKKYLDEIFPYLLIGNKKKILNILIKQKYNLPSKLDEKLNTLLYYIKKSNNYNITFKTSIQKTQRLRYRRFISKRLFKPKLVSSNANKQNNLLFIETVLYIITFFMKINYPINENIMENMVTVIPDNLLIELVIKYNLCVEKIIGILLKNKLWDKINLIYANKTLDYSEENYKKNHKIIIKNINSHKFTSKIHIEIAKYNMTKYKIKPTINLKKHAIATANLPMIRKLVQIYKFKFTYDEIKNHLKYNCRRRYLKSNTSITKLYNMIEYLSIQFPIINNLFINNELYLLLKKNYYQIDDEIIINIFKKNLLILELDHNIISGLIHNNNYTVIDFLLSNKKFVVKTDYILMSGYTFDIFKLLIKNLPENINFSNDEILLGIKDESLSEETILFLVDNDYLILTPNIITFFLLLNCDYPDDIIIKIIQKYPHINYKVYDSIVYTKNILQQNIFNNIYSRYIKTKIKKIIIQFDYIINYKNNLNIKYVNNPPYVMANITIDESNLDLINKIFEINNNEYHPNGYVDYEYINEDIE